MTLREVIETALNDIAIQIKNADPFTALRSGFIAERLKQAIEREGVWVPRNKIRVLAKDHLWFDREDLWQKAIPMDELFRRLWAQCPDQPTVVWVPKEKPERVIAMEAVTKALFDYKAPLNDRSRRLLLRRLNAAINEASQPTVVWHSVGWSK